MICNGHSRAPVQIIELKLLQVNSRKAIDTAAG